MAKDERQLDGAEDGPEKPPAAASEGGARGVAVTSTESKLCEVMSAEAPSKSGGASESMDGCSRMESSVGSALIFRIRSISGTGPMHE